MKKTIINNGKKSVKKPQFKNYYDLHQFIKGGKMKIGDIATVNGKSIKVVPANEIDAIGCRVNYKIVSLSKADAYIKTYYQRIEDNKRFIKFMKQQKRSIF